MRISGITLPENKRLEIALTAVYGIGRPRAHMIIGKLGLNPGMRTTELTADEENLIRVFRRVVGVRRRQQLDD